jgi:hypothetical protein
MTSRPGFTGSATGLTTSLHAIPHVDAIKIVGPQIKSQQKYQN